LKENYNKKKRKINRKEEEEIPSKNEIKVIEIQREINSSKN
jgi:hypothetical protein